MTAPKVPLFKEMLQALAAKVDILEDLIEKEITVLFIGRADGTGLADDPVKPKLDVITGLLVLCYDKTRRSKWHNDQFSFNG